MATLCSDRDGRVTDDTTVRNSVQVNAQPGNRYWRWGVFFAYYCSLHRIFFYQSLSPEKRGVVYIYSIFILAHLEFLRRGYGGYKW